MKNLFIIIALLIFIPSTANADTIVFMDGTKIDVPKAWEENGEIKCKMAGIAIGYPKAEVKQVTRQKQSAVPRKLRASEIVEVARTQPGSCYDLGKRYGYCTTLTLLGFIRFGIWDFGPPWPPARRAYASESATAYIIYTHFGDTSECNFLNAVIINQVWARDLGFKTRNLNHPHRRRRSRSIVEKRKIASIMSRTRTITRTIRKDKR